MEVVRTFLEDMGLASCRAAWPRFEVDAEQFARHVSGVAGDGDNADAVAKLELTDLYLAFACAQGDAAALDSLNTREMVEIRPALAKIGLTAPVIDDVLQRVREELLVPKADGRCRILGYAGRGTLRSWLRSVAVRTGMRMAKTSPNHDELGPDDAISTDDPELAYMKRTYGDAFQRGFQAALGRLPAKDRLLLKQRFRHGMGVEDLGALYAVHAGTITRRVQAARDALAALTRSAMMDELGVGTVELDSILRLIHSQLDINLSSA